MSENYDRTEEKSRAVEKPEDRVEVVGGGEAEAADEEAVPNVVAEHPPYTNQAVSDMTPDQTNAAVARGLLTVPQMNRLVGGSPQAIYTF